MRGGKNNMVAYGFTVIIEFTNDDVITIDFVHEISESVSDIYFKITETDIRHYSRNYINKIEIKNI